MARWRDGTIYVRNVRWFGQPQNDKARFPVPSSSLPPHLSTPELKEPWPTQHAPWSRMGPGKLSFYPSLKYQRIAILIPLPLSLVIDFIERPRLHLEPVRTTWSCAWRLPWRLGYHFTCPSAVYERSCLSHTFAHTWYLRMFSFSPIWYWEVVFDHFEI